MNKEGYTKKDLLLIGRKIYPEVNNYIFQVEDFIDNVCDLCGSGNDDHRKFAITENNADLFFCKNCGLYYVNPRPSEDALARYYAFYYRANNEEIAWWKYATHKKFVRAANIISRFTPDYDKILDIGCGYGFFLQILNRKNVWNSGLGIDLDLNGIQYANENSEFFSVKYSQTDIHDGSTLKNGVFSAISAQALLEHVSKPRNELVRINQLLKPGGILYLTVPSEMFWIRLKHYFSFIPFRAMLPVHLYNFTPRTLIRYLRETGFEIKYLSISTPIRHPNMLTNILVRISKIAAYTLRLLSFGHWISTIGGGIIVVAKKNSKNT